MSDTIERARPLVPATALPAMPAGRDLDISAMIDYETVDSRWRAVEADPLDQWPRSWMRSRRREGGRGAESWPRALGIALSSPARGQGAPNSVALQGQWQRPSGLL